MKKISVELDEELLRRLKDTSSLGGTSPERMVTDAIAHYIYYNESHQCMLTKALEALKKGDIATAPDMTAAFERWGVEVALPANIVWSGLALRAWCKDLEAFAEYGSDLAHKVAQQVADCLKSPDFAKRAFPGQLPGMLEIGIEGCPYSVTFRKDGDKLQVLGVTQLAL